MGLLTGLEIWQQAHGKAVLPLLSHYPISKHLSSPMGHMTLLYKHPTSRMLSTTDLGEMCRLTGIDVRPENDLGSEMGVINRNPAAATFYHLSKEGIKLPPLTSILECLYLYIYP